jgi:5-amino-6-(5-phospho-D-ribitylamino)uracil phosphatase
MATRNRYRMLALDVDGTLLDPQGTLRQRTVAAVTRAAQAGILPVLCTGRRYRRARPIAEQLRLNSPLVCNSGAIVKDPNDGRTLWRADFDAALTERVLALFQRHAEPAVVFTDRAEHEPDFIVKEYPTGRAPFDDYVTQNQPHVAIDAAWPWSAVDDSNRDNGSPPATLFHLFAIGTHGAMLDFQKKVHCELEGQVQTFVQRSPRYVGFMCEILRHDAGKWAAILHLAERWGIAADEICAIGDDANDIPMLRSAGLGVAMGHARREVQDAAGWVTGSHDEDGVATLVDQILRQRHTH